MLDKLLKNKKEYPFINKDYYVYKDTKDLLVLFNEESNTFYIEGSLKEWKKFNFDYEYSYDKIITTSREIYNYEFNNYRKKIECNLYYLKEVDNKKITNLENFRIVGKDDYDYIIRTYGIHSYIMSTYKRNKLYGYYINNKIIGYIGIEINGDIGFIYVDPNYRNMGYGKKMVTYMCYILGKKIKYSLVDIENIDLVHVFDNLDNSILSKKMVYCLYNHDFDYK